MGVVWGVGDHQMRVAHRMSAALTPFFILYYLILKNGGRQAPVILVFYSAVSVISVSEQWTVMFAIVPQTPFESSYILCHISAVPA